MHSELLDQVARPAEVTPVVAFHEVSKWYGNVIGINKLTLEIRPGVTGLLGPNGAGKSTLLQLATGQLRPSQGSSPRAGSDRLEQCRAQSLDRPVPGAGCLLRMDDRLGFRPHLCPTERASSPRRPRRRRPHDRRRRHDQAPWTARSAVTRKACGSGSSSPRPWCTIPRSCSSTSRSPAPIRVARRDLMDIIQRLGSEGKSVLVSSHVLHEVESLTPNIVLLNHGRLVAEGHIRQIRDLIDNHPHHIVLVSRRLSQARQPAPRLGRRGRRARDGGREAR